MIYNKNGTVFEYNSVKYTIGGRIKATAESIYAGLYGRILEIRTDTDQDTENEMPDIYCAFDSPALPSEIKKLENRFAALYGSPKALDEIPLSPVVMAPSMVIPLRIPGDDQPMATLFMLVCHWVVDGEGDMSVDMFTSIEDARLKLHDDLLWEKRSGCLSNWNWRDSFIEEDSEKSYEGYLDGEYWENHFSLEIQEKKIPLSPSFIRSVVEVGAGNYKECIRNEN